MQDILESVGRKTSIASVIIKVSSAINKLLLGQWSESSTVSNHLVSLETTNSGESPARSTMSLVLDWGDSMEVSPIKGKRWRSLDIVLSDRHSLVSGRAVLLITNSLNVVVGHELLLGEIGELVDTLGEG